MKRSGQAQRHGFSTIGEELLAADALELVAEPQEIVVAGHQQRERARQRWRVFTQKLTPLLSGIDVGEAPASGVTLKRHGCLGKAAGADGLMAATDGESHDLGAEVFFIFDRAPFVRAC